MATTSHIARAAALVAAAAAVLLFGAAATPHNTPPWALPSEDLDGHAPHVADSKRPAVHAAFPRQSYRQGGVARLVFYDDARNVSFRVMRAGTVQKQLLANDLLTGSPVTRTRRLTSIRPGASLTLRLGDWPSGVYYVELHAPGERVGYALFVLSPRALGKNDVAVVEPTQTWQAYNFRDDNRDGVPDTWYWSGTHARLGRPFLNRGVPNHFKYYDMPFLQWLSKTHRHVDVLSDADLNGVTGRELRAAYKLVVFPGHHEYATEHEYDAVTSYRNLGGHLMWLSANNFFWKITIDGKLMTRVVKWRDLGRPEASLIGVQYFHNDMGEHRGAWIVQRSTSARWLFAGTALKAGDGFSSGGIEADCITPDSPHGTQIVAEIPNLYGPGMTADMTYYTTPAGAQVFAAGAFSLADAIRNPQVRRLVTNVWIALDR
jgi:hypothetical protein